MGNSKAFKRLIRRYEFLLEDFEDVVKISQEANSVFIQELHKEVPPEFSTEDYVEDYIEAPIEDSRSDSDMDKSLKKLFRKIVFECHPDKLVGDYTESEISRRIELYEKAVIASEERNWAAMVIVAIKLGIEIPEEAEEMLESINEEVKVLEKKIEEKSRGYVWDYLHSDEEGRKSILESYIKLLVKIKNNKEDKKVREENKGTNPDSIASSKFPTILGVGHFMGGTDIMSDLISSWGIEIGHNEMGEYGFSDWSILTELISGNENLNLEKNLRIYCVRDPRIIINGLVNSKESESEIKEELYDIVGITSKNPILDSIMLINKWDSIIRDRINPSFIFRLEDQQKELFSYLENIFSVDLIYKENLECKTFDNLELAANLEKYLPTGIPKGYRSLINLYCRKYGYRSI